MPENRILAAALAAAVGGTAALLSPAIPAQAQERGWHQQPGQPLDRGPYGMRDGGSRDTGGYAERDQDRWSSGARPQGMGGQGMQARTAPSQLIPPVQDRHGSGPDWRQQARASFEQGYRQGRIDERRSRAEQGSGDGGQRSASEGGRAGMAGERVLVIPNVYPDDAPFQQFVVLPDYSRSMEWLLAAAQGLREAIQAMAQQPPSAARNRAIAEAQDAILQTQDVMLLLPPDLRTRG